jgi:predicted component of type VI protein secretion system
MKKPTAVSALAEYLDRYRAALVILSGDARGLEYRLDQPRTALGRGPGVDLALDDASLRCKHASVEFQSGVFVLCDLDAEGRAERGLELKDGDRFRLGDLELGFTQSLRDTERSQ